MTQQTNLTKRWQFNSHSWKDIKACATIMDTQLFALGSLNLKRILCKILQIIMLVMVIKATMEQDCQNIIFHSSSRWFVCDTSVQSLLLHCRILTPELPHFDTWIAAFRHLRRILCYFGMITSHFILNQFSLLFWRQKLEELNFWSILFGLMNFVLNGISNFFASHLYTIKTKITDQGVQCPLGLACKLLSRP